MRVILASTSPRRSQILSLLGIEFEVIPAKVEEEVIPGKPVLTARKLAKEKALSVWRENRDAVVIGADTLVFLGNEIIGKPKDEKDAVNILKKLSGKWHSVVTALCVYSPEKVFLTHDIAKVKFRELSKEEIISYVKSGEPMDKAGAYGVQGFGATIVERIHGNFYTVMGLPIVKLYKILRELNLLAGTFS
ncbi:Maf family protein [Aquifex aeolicus]|uniref:dTTP/UTP pyrophosphatase n=1 Tax=Aquifex aeolicus (strain VF5) TaxID=224324 RepID=NTPPA_AQUAE|nr:nucleoside triphosphate pyrophosphatase [Aquifex aeolicus]O67613.1 RecName: Full=dTTP/UTP pyrophosphatase; Short=dTTPase/UTPase; AltName: Full=Nucleoside triphosphate pyrophosphatase; AltName: Full=Nucleotide pyrophosphatase; Short=Nucleotide PPase [Aquifex aeolicus VF5]AAC07569.1 MAF protein [Aquifex aeolicus VF5]